MLTSPTGHIFICMVWSFFHHWRPLLHSSSLNDGVKAASSVSLVVDVLLIFVPALTAMAPGQRLQYDVHVSEVAACLFGQMFCKKL